MEPNHQIQMDLEDDDLGFQSQNISSNPQDYQFDMIVQKLQQAVLGKDYEKIQKQFFHKYCMIFEDTEENKIQYMGIFKEYQSIIEKHLLKELQTLPNFSMNRFQELLEPRKDQIDQQILDMLVSSTEFSQFKAIMLDARKEQQQANKLQVLFTIKSSKAGMKSDKKQNNIFSKAQYDLNQPFSIEGLKAPIPGKGSKKKN